METKKTVKLFSVVDWEKEQNYLREMHRQGWKFVRLTALGVYHFEKCEPEDVIYQLDYNADGLAHKEEYVQLFADCGWEYLQDYLGYSYFRKSASQTDGAEEIFCDDASRLQLLERVGRGRMLPMLVIFLCVMLPGLLCSIAQGEGVLAALLGIIVAVYLFLCPLLLPVPADQRPERISRNGFSSLLSEKSLPERGKCGTNSLCIPITLRKKPL